MGLRVFLVEDNPVIRENLSESLEELADAHAVAWAGNANDAKAWLETHRSQWDLAVIDLFLEQGSGLDVLINCRERTRQQRAVVLTNYATPIIRERCMALGADAVFDKSDELEEFMRFTQADAPRTSGFAAL